MISLDSIKRMLYISKGQRSSPWRPMSKEPEVLPGLAKLEKSFDEFLIEQGREYLVASIVATNGNITRAARIAGRNRTEFYWLLDRHGIHMLGGTVLRALCTDQQCTRYRNMNGGCDACGAPCL